MQEGHVVGSGVLYSCLGLSGLYLKHASGLDYVLKAWEYSNMGSTSSTSGGSGGFTMGSGTGSSNSLGGDDVLYSDIFTLPTEALDKNLVSAYRAAGRMDSCWDIASKSITRNRFHGKTSGVGDTPFVKNNTEYNAYIVIFSFVDWFSTSSTSIEQ